ncbi:hypothetical protein [Desulfovermiculus halophilus]|uniref:hypothetical protein n=1 Tax=Desulfovermiculus halophilus TaxID=339722 RepID=UPI000687ADBC|nr:hypothetical protein [Desulfovermiculus halophilus]
MSGKNDRQNRDDKGRFTKGNPGGPGRKPGEPSRVACLVREQWIDQAQQVAQTVLEQALSGDLEAARIVLERLYPKPKDNPVSLELPEGANLTQMTEAVLQAVAVGHLTPQEGHVVASIVSSHAKVHEVEYLKERLASLERALNFRIQQEKKK